MKSIYKYSLEVKDGLQTIALPVDAQVLTVQERHHGLVLWAIVDTDSATDTRVGRMFRVLGTGWPFPDGEAGRYIATAQIGAYVWHVFEITELS